jgi:hypothetical protein
MQLVPRYLYKNKIDVVSNDTGFVVEYRPVYSRQLKVYRGIDNQLQFRLLNADQKPILITETPVLVVFDESNSKIIEKDCTIQDDGTSRATRGTFTATITENDLLNIKQQYLHYNVYLKDATGQNTLTYANGHFDSAGTIYVDGNAFPGPKSSVEITNFLPIDDYWAAGSDDSNKITAEPGLNGNEALHTVAVYTDAYIGDVEIQATLDNQITGSNNWTTVDTLTFAGTETQPVPSSFNGVYTFIRFKASADPDNKITKILVRN